MITKTASLYFKCPPGINCRGHLMALDPHCHRTCHINNRGAAVGTLYKYLRTGELLIYQLFVLTELKIRIFSLAQGRFLCYFHYFRSLSSSPVQWLEAPETKFDYLKKKATYVSTNFYSHLVKTETIVAFCDDGVMINVIYCFTYSFIQKHKYCKVGELI